MATNNIDQLQKYFLSFRTKNVEELNNIFSEGVELKDWNNEFVGKPQVMEEIVGIFQNFDTIKLDIVQIYKSSNNKFACEIEIFLDGEMLRVMDLIDFNDDGKITQLVAYKR